jgi:hypothetical protein
MTIAHPNEGARNWRQERVETPLMLRALDLPRRARVLEVGCGRGIALPPLARYLAAIATVEWAVDRQIENGPQDGALIGALLESKGQSAHVSATGA